MARVSVRAFYEGLDFLDRLVRALSTREISSPDAPRSRVHRAPRGPARASPGLSRLEDGRLLVRLNGPLLAASPRPSTLHVQARQERTTSATTPAKEINMKGRDGPDGISGPRGPSGSGPLGLQFVQDE